MRTIWLPWTRWDSVSADFQQMRAEIYRYIYIPSARTAATTTIDGVKSNIKTNIDDLP